MGKPNNWENRLQRKEKDRLQRKEKEKDELVHFISKMLKVFGVFLVLLVVLGGAFYTVPTGHRGVLTTFGDPSLDAKPEGFGFKIPIAQKVKDIEVRTQKIETTSDSSSKDLQDVQTTIALNFHINPEQTPYLYKGIGMDYSNRIIVPAIEESVKAISATFTAEELITKRPQVRDAIKAMIKSKLKKYYLTVDDFNIVNFQFSKEFDKAIESKVTAEQLKLKAERDLERIKIEKQQKITQAQAEAESIRIQSEALKANEDILELRFIEKWDGKLSLVTGSGQNIMDISSFMHDD